MERNNKIKHPSTKYAEWPKKPTSWVQDRTVYISIPFTWNLPRVKRQLMQKGLFWDKAVVGGPAVNLIPDYFKELDFVSNGKSGLLAHRINPFATKTTTGCVRKCEFCAVPKTEPKFNELDDWPDLPILIDNNLLAASIKHFDKVIDRLVKWGWADFNQGLDARLLNTYHARRFKEIKQPMIRIALDDIRYKDQWSIAFDKLMKAGIAKANIRSYALVGYNSGVDEAWERCEWVELHGIKVLPMWFHELDAMEYNEVTEKQAEMGWNDLERKRIMQWYYQHNKKYGMPERGKTVASD